MYATPQTSDTDTGKGNLNMGWLNVDEAIFYGLCWGVGFLSSLFVTLGGPNNKSIDKCLYVGGISGFLAFAVITLFVGRVSEPISGHWYYLGLATLIGLATKFHDAIIEFMIEKFGLLSGSKIIDANNEQNERVTEDIEPENKEEN